MQWRGLAGDCDTRYRPDESMLRCWGEMVNDAVSLAARAHRAREADRPPHKEFLEAEAWLFDPTWDAGWLPSRDGTLVRAVSFERVAAALNVDVDGFRRTLRGRAIALAGRHYTKRRLGYHGEVRYNQSGPLRPKRVLAHRPRRSAFLTLAR